jgi:hypothetical protein
MAVRPAVLMFAKSASTKASDIPYVNPSKLPYSVLMCCVGNDHLTCKTPHRLDTSPAMFTEI